MKEKEYISYLKSLEGRHPLTNEQRKDLTSISIGREGEEYFQSVLNNIGVENMLRDFEFGSRNHIQADFIVTSSNKVFVFEIKHYNNEWYFDGDYIKNTFGMKYQSPVLQIQRIRNELQEIFYKTEINRVIEPIIIFTNPHFSLIGNRPREIQVLLPHELDKLFKIIHPNQSIEDQAVIRTIQQFENIHSKYYQKEIYVEFEKSKKD
ncbi:nuclease-related domain-containing protein [Mammaliicoccus sp. Dog046]|uniref:nuclease-related domain-containing protein n=1 Tax=Mammaliicoccus sp. Dog046 TaxID=3034233 RepID=UPI002B2634A9|nr:nuclease-related domain-containing protein [Mammaliicoccus sp. Dog046]WQK86450.1 nuclease-related domain-containing protein [Mammaliicoccus sp. Dog046]